MAPAGDSAADRWRQCATAEGLLLPRPKLGSVASMTASYTDTGRHCGVSLEYLRCLAASLRSECEGTWDSTSSLLQRWLLPALAKQACKRRLWDLVPPEYTGMPQWYICHDGSESFFDLVAAVGSDLKPKSQPQPQPQPQPQSQSQPQPRAPLAANQGQDVIVWLDIFAINHYSPASTPEEAAQAAEEVLDACSQGLLLVVGQGLACLDNIMCLHDVFIMAYTKGECSIRITLPELGLDETLAVKRSCTNIDISKAGASKPQDKSFILSEVRRRIGLKRTNLLLAQALSSSLHCKLRWRSSLAQLASLGAAMFKAGELSQLQLLLASIRQVKVEDSSLKDMRDLFKAFDADGSGELDEMEFLQVLKSASYGDEDALAAFHEINVSGTGFVTLEEFEAWWMEHHRDERPDQTFPALVERLKAMAGYLDGQRLPDHAQAYRSAAQQLHDSMPSSHAKLALPPPAFKGDLQVLLDAASHKVLTEPLPTCNALFEYLQKNTEVLHIDPATLPAPGKIGRSQEYPLLLALYMLTLVEMFEFYHLLAEKKGIVKSLLATAAQLQDEHARERRRPLELPRGKHALSSHSLAEIMRSGTASGVVSKDKVASFQKSMGEFMAGARKMTRYCGPVATADVAESTGKAGIGGVGGGARSAAAAAHAATASVQPALAALRAALADAAAATPAAPRPVGRRDSMINLDAAPADGAGAGAALSCERSFNSSPSCLGLGPPLSELSASDVDRAAGGVDAVVTVSTLSPTSASAASRRRSFLLVGSCSAKLQSMSETLGRMRAVDEHEPLPTGASTERTGYRATAQAPVVRARSRRASAMQPGRVNFSGVDQGVVSAPDAAQQAADAQQHSSSTSADGAEQHEDPASAPPPPAAPGNGRAGGGMLRAPSLQLQQPAAMCRLPSMLRHSSSTVVSRSDVQASLVHAAGFPTLKLPDLRRMRSGVALPRLTGALADHGPAQQV